MKNLVAKAGIFLLALYVLSIWGAGPGFWRASGASASDMGVTVIKLTGTLTPFEPGWEGATKTLVLHFGDRDWLFHYTYVGGQIEKEYPSWLVINLIGPEGLRVVGPEAAVADLSNPAIAGKSITIRGALYPSTRMLYLGGVCSIDGRPAGVC